MIKKFLSASLCFFVLTVSSAVFAADSGGSNKVFTLSENLDVEPSSGTASISIPIEVPQGRAGIQPNVTLLYNSSGGNGPLGVGWSMELGYIQRSTKKGTPKYNNTDTFVLVQAGSSQELVDVSGNATEFRPETEGAFSKIKFDGTSWIITDRKGTKYYFGTNATSRVADPASATRIFKWCFERAEDINGNYMTVSYFSADNQLYPQEIKYTGNSTLSLPTYASVKFSYDAKTNPADTANSFMTGFQILQTKRLSTIEVRAEGNLARKYTLNYIQASVTAKSLLNSVTLVGADGVSTLPATKMTYSQPSYTLDASVNVSNLPGNLNDPKYRMIDMNNDGLPDLLDASVANNWKAYPNTSKNGTISFASAVSLPTSPDVSGDNIDGRFVDLNGDGLLDYIRWVSGGNPLVWINSGAVNFYAKQSSPIILSSVLSDGVVQFLDMNGDGALDMIVHFKMPLVVYGGQLRPAPKPSKIYFNDGLGNFGVAVEAKNTPFNPSGTTTDGKWTDYNGDGLLDVIFREKANNCMIYFNNSIDGFNLKKTISSLPVNWVLWSDLYSADMNGDGLADILLTGATYSLYLNNGKGDFNTPIVMANSPNIGLDKPTVKLVDFNGDNLPDVVISGAPYKVYINNGNGGFLPPTSLANYPSVGLDNPSISLVDINGDGMLDIVQGQVSNYKFWINSPNVRQSQGNSLLDVDNSVGGHLELQYQNLPVKGWGGLQYGIVSRTMFNSVKTISRRASPTGDVYVSNYEYTNGLWDNKSKEFRGFKTVKMIDRDGNYSVTEYAQDDIYKGRPLTQASYDSAGRLFSKSVNTWANQVLYSGVNFPYLKQTDSYIYDGDATGRRTQAQFFFEESPQYGNLTKSINFGEVDLTTGADIGTDKSTTEVTYHNNTTNWLLGLPKTTTIKDNAGAQFAKTTFYYDANMDYTVLPVKGYLTKKLDWAGDAVGTVHPFTTYTYDAIGNLLTTADSNNSTTSISYDTTYRMFPLETTNALGHKVTNEYYGINGVPLSGADTTFGLWGQLKSTTDPNLKKGLRIYDTFGRTVKMVSPLDTIALPTSSYEYVYGTSQLKVIVHQRIQSGSPETMDAVQFTDGLGRRIQTKSKSATLGKFIVSGQSEYNSRGLPIKKYVPYLTSTPLSELDVLDTTQPYTLITYDAMGRVIRTTAPDGSYSNGVYDDWNSTSFDENGHMQKSYADAFGRLIKKEEYEGADGRHAAYPASAYTLYATTLYTYDSKGNLIKTQDAKGNITTINYDTLGRKIQMTDPDMGTWKYGYDVEGNLIWQEDAKGQKVNFTYDQINRLKTKSDLSILTVNYTYDDVNAQNTKGRLTKASYGGGNTGFSYDELGRELQSIKAIGATNFSVNRTYDALDRLLELQYPEGSRIAYTYNGAGQAVKVSGNSSVAPAIAPTILVQPANVTVTEGSKATFSVVATGTALTYQWYLSVNNGPFTAIAGQTSLSHTIGAVSLADTGNKYKCVVTGSAGSVTSNVVTLTVNPAVLPSITMQPVNVTTTVGSTTTFEVLATGNPNPTYQWMQKPAGASTYTAISGATKAYYTTVVTTLANSGTVYKVIVTNVAGSVASNEVTLTVDPKPTDLTITTQPASATVTSSYAATLKVVASGTTPTYQWMQAAPGSNTYTDIAGATSASYLIPPTTLANNGTKYKVIVTNASGSVVSNVATLTVCSWPMENLTSPANNSTFAAGTDITLTANASEINGTIVNVAFYNGTTLLGSSNLAPYSYTLKNAQPGTYYFTVKTRDAKGTFGGSPSIKVTVNPPVVTNNEYVKNVDYNATGQMTKVEFGNGVVTTYTYSPTMLRLTNTKTVNALGTVLQDFSYTYDGVGNITAIVDAVNTASQTFKYDALNRLSLATGVGYGTKTYTYDQIGNIISKDALTYTYSNAGAPCPPTLCGGGPHAVTSLSDGTTITYDANGNMSTKSKSGEVMQYLYDSENRLTQVKKNTTLIADYLYDGDGGRVQKTSYLVTTNTVSGGFGALTGSQQIVSTPVITKYVGEMYEQTGNVGTMFIFLGSQRIAAIDTVTGTPLYYHGDHLGSTNVISDSNGTVSELIEYDPYGKISRHDGINGSTRWAKQQFTGKKLDDETGLIYFGARYYDPSLGRFITPDTIVQNPSDPQTLNRYSYCSNNPINRTDPSGHSWFKKFMKRYGDFFNPLMRATVTGDWKDFGFAVLNSIAFTSGNPWIIAGGCLSLAAQATSHIGGNVADEISSSLGYAAIGVGLIGAGIEIKNSFPSPTKAGGAGGTNGASTVARSNPVGYEKLTTPGYREDNLTRMFNNIKTSVPEKISLGKQIVLGAIHAGEVINTGIAGIGFGLAMDPLTLPEGAAAMLISGRVGLALGAAESIVTESWGPVINSGLEMATGKVAAFSVLKVTGQELVKFNFGAARFVAEGSPLFIKTVVGQTSMMTEIYADTFASESYKLIGAKP